MHPFLCIDLTADKKNEQFNGTEFLAAQPSAALNQSFARSSENAENTIAESKLPLPMRIVQLVCGALAGLIGIGILKGLTGSDSVPLSQAYQNASWLFWLGGGCLLIWGLLKLISLHKEKTVLGTEESIHTLATLDGVCDAIYAELAVPSNAIETDILSFFYKDKNGKRKVCEKAMQLSKYSNPVFRAFSDSENLYLANLEGKYAFPLSSLASIRSVKKHIRIAGWNKAQSFNKGRYTQYKLTADQYGCIHCKYYYILELHHNGEAWGIYFPCYELPVFEKLSGLKAAQE